MDKQLTASTSFFSCLTVWIKPCPCRLRKFLFATGTLQTVQSNEETTVRRFGRGHFENNSNTFKSFLPLQYRNLRPESAHSGCEQLKSMPCGSSEAISKYALSELWSFDKPRALHVIRREDDVRILLDGGGCSDDDDVSRSGSKGCF